MNSTLNAMPEQLPSQPLTPTVYDALKIFIFSWDTFDRLEWAT